MRCKCGGFLRHKRLLKDGIQQRYCKDCKAVAFTTREGEFVPNPGRRLTPQYHDWTPDDLKGVLPVPSRHLVAANHALFALTGFTPRVAA